MRLVEENQRPSGNPPVKKKSHIGLYIMIVIFAICIGSGAFAVVKISDNKKQEEAEQSQVSKNDKSTDKADSKDAEEKDSRETKKDAEEDVEPVEGTMTAEEKAKAEEKKKEEEENEKVIDEPIEVDGQVYHMTGVSMGNPHTVIYVDDVKNLDLEKIGPKFENHERFPKRINTEFVHCIDRNTVEMRVWERGSGETLACGTGACAVAVASILNNLTDTRVTVKLLGGDLQIEWDREKNHVFMTGPAKVVFDGVIDITEIKE